MNNVRTIYLDWNNGSIRATGGSQLAYQYDHLSNLVIFENAPKLDNYYLIVEMKETEDGEVRTFEPIQLAGSFWLVPNSYTQLAQNISFQVCCKAENGDFERHSAQFTGIILPSKNHAGAELDVDPSIMFDPYKQWVSDIAMAAGAIVIDPTLSIQGAAADAKAVGDAVNGLNERLAQISGEAKSLTWTNGAIKADDGTLNTASNYKHTNLIAVTPGDKYTVVSRGSTSYFILGMYAAESDTSADLSESIKGSNTAQGAMQTVTGTIPNGINYVRVGCATTDYQSASLIIYQNGSLTDVIEKLGNAESDIDGLQSDLQELQAETDDIKYAVSHNDLLRAVTWSNGFVKNDGTLKPQTVNTYNYSTLIPVEPGERYKYSLDASSGTFIIAAYESENDASAITAKSVRGTDTIASGTYVVPTGVNYIRVTIRYSSYAGLYFYKRTSLSDITAELRTAQTDIAELKNRTNEEKYNNNIRTACVCFQMDDATSPTNPTSIKTIFDTYGYNLGWVLPTHDNNNEPISQEVIDRHLGYQASGDEIICHGKNHTINWTDTTQTDSQIDTYLKESKATLEGYGFIINGFVPTMSAMAAKYRYLMRKYYQYGYSVYTGVYDGTRRSYYYPTDGVYNLWRVSIEGNTLANMKAALDAAIEAGGCITFYSHPMYYNNASYNLTTENLNALLTYVQEKEQAGLLTVGVPNEIVRNYFDVRNDDVVKDWIAIDPASVEMSASMDSPLLWSVYYSRKMNLLSLGCRLRPSVTITGETTLFKLPVKVALNNIMVQDELGLPIKIVNATTGSEVKLVGETASWTRSTMDRLHIVCMLSFAEAALW